MITPYVLIFIAAVGQTPANLGTFPSEKSCLNAMRRIYETRLYGAVIPKSPELDAVIDIQLKYQEEYRCIPK